MALTEDRLASLALYCRIDLDDVGAPELLTLLYQSAVSYMTQAGVPEPTEGTDRRSQYDMVINYLVLDGYDRRDASTSGSVSENPAFRRMLNQLKMTVPVSESDTSGA